MIGHRTSVVNQGSAFADMGDAMNLYGYNTRGEVTNAVRRWGNNPNNPGDPVAGQTFGYAYDPIRLREETTAGQVGNRTWSKRGYYSREYDANELNQMTSRGVPGVAHLLGSADTNATVTVNGQSVTRQNAYWYKDLAVANDTAPQYPEVVIDAARFNIRSSVTGNVFVAQTPEDFGYDADGNMTNDGRFAYTWDGENRLIAVETLPAVVAASGAPQVRVEYAYDYMSRRIGKTVFNVYTNGAYTATDQAAYLYDGWNLISETILNQQSQITNLYVWGIDLSQTLQGAGGIGGLLSMHISPLPLGEGQGEGSTVFPCFDANGNIGQLLDATNPTDILAHYEYDPFGNTITQKGPLADANPYRFSTKYHEDESGLVYYGYRYYKPDIGRWVNRDPIEERGGLNVYGFVGNNPVLASDVMGLIGEYWPDGINEPPFEPTVIRSGWSISSGGRSRSAAIACNATVQELAIDIGLDAAEYREWLIPERGSIIPPSESRIWSGSYTVPNTIIITRGNTYDISRSLQQGQIWNIGSHINQVIGRRFRFDNKGYPGVRGYSLDQINSFLSNTENIWGWLHYGHGGENFQGSTQTGFRGTLVLQDENFRFDSQRIGHPPSSFSIGRYKLGGVFLAACGAGTLGNEWRARLVSGNGVVYATPDAYYAMNGFRQWQRY